jgi:lipopolysaccharide/colanic/teichoic acid biosynthesis glycosyltransferase
VQCSALGPSVEVDDVQGVTVLGINPSVLSRSSRMAKRALDLVGAALCWLYLEHDPRIVPIGRLLRPASLDELLHLV